MNRNTKLIAIASVVGIVCVGLIAWIAIPRNKGQESYPLIKLNNGKLMPQIGLGVWKMSDAQATQAVKDAVSVGYRHIDTAWRYLNEKGTGQGIRDLIADGTIKRSDIFLTSKVWNTFHGRSLAVDAIQESLRNFGLDYLDLALIHWPTGFKPGTGEQYPRYPNGSNIPSSESNLDTWRGMEDALRRGLAKTIGVSNFNIRQLEELLREASIKPAVNQIEIHPFLVQNELVDYCQKNGIAVTAYSPIRQADRNLLDNTLLNKIGRKYGKTAVQVILRWHIQRDIIVIPKTVHKQRMIENIDIFDFKLTDEEMSKISALNSNQRQNDIPGNKDHPDYPFNY